MIVEREELSERETGNGSRERRRGLWGTGLGRRTGRTEAGAGREKMQAKEAGAGPGRQKDERLRGGQTAEWAEKTGADAGLSQESPEKDKKGGKQGKEREGKAGADTGLSQARPGKDKGGGKRGEEREEKNGADAGLSKERSGKDKGGDKRGKEREEKAGADAGLSKERPEKDKKDGKRGKEQAEKPGPGSGRGRKPERGQRSADVRETDPAHGLTEAEAAQRRAEEGENVLEQPPAQTIAGMFAEQLNDPLIFILLIAAAISMALREMSDTAIILAVIVMNGAVGVIQEGKAKRGLEALKKLTSPTAVVKREGIYREIPASELVVGDLVSLEAGCQIPADLRLISSHSMKVEESALTGESIPVSKRAGDRVCMTTNVTYGRGEGIVEAVGMRTEIGKIASMLKDSGQEQTPLQKKLGELGKVLSICAVILCAALFLIAVIQHKNIPEMMITAISLAVAAVPEGLPAVVTIVLALGVSRMVRVHAIVRRLPAVETLGAVNVVCSDKTGTLTQNKMKVVQCYLDGRFCAAGELDRERDRIFLEGFALCGDAKYSGGIAMGDPTEIALMELGTELGLEKEKLEQAYPRVDELPFDSKRKMMTTVHRCGGERISYTKGSCDAVLRRCSGIWKKGRTEKIQEADRRQIREAAETLSSRALRVLALAMRERAACAEESGLVFVGLAAMMDPPREEAAEAIALFGKAGVKTVMITGDHVDTAYAIAKKLGITDTRKACITGEELDELSDGELERRTGRLRVFARVSPQHKVRIVKAFKAGGNVTAMTGDGVNDAPSLKAADIGIAMGKCGTDVAKNAADMILTDDNFATIERAIEEGRGIYENIKKSVVFLLSSNFGEIITMFLAVLAGVGSPLRASHILWVNLITDSLPALALGVDENDRSMLMQRPPRSSGESMFSGGGLFCTLFYGCLIALVSLAAFFSVPLSLPGVPEAGLDGVRAALQEPMVLARAQTYAFTVLGLSELFHAVGMRNVEKSFFRTNPFSNRLMIAAFFAGLGLQVAATELPYLTAMFETVPLAFREWAGLIFLSAMPLIAHELFLFQPVEMVRRHLKKFDKSQRQKEKAAEPGKIQ